LTHISKFDHGKFLHKESEVYNEAMRKLPQIPIPTQLGENINISVKYEEEKQTVYYTVSFIAMFGGDDRTFVGWDYLSMRMHVQPKT
jgi:hypothetical protein